MNNEQRDRRGAFSDHEKAHVREQIRAYMRAHPAQAPLRLRILDSFQRTTYSPRFQLASAALGAVMVAGTGTAFAAQNALPGDPLYGVKVNLEEPIQGAFATSAQAKADWSAQLAARRLSEAEQLAAQDKLTPSAATTIAGGLDQATEDFDENVAQIATSSDNAATVATLASTMEATLAANTQVMTELESAVPNVANVLSPILSSVQERTISLNKARTQLDMIAARTDAQQARSAAQAELNTAEDQVSAIASSTEDTSTATSSAAQVAQAQYYLQSGRQNLAQGDYSGALESLQAASVEANAVQLNVSVDDQLQQSSGIQLPVSTTSMTISAVIDAGEATSTATSTMTTGTSTSTAPSATSTEPKDARHHSRS